MKRNTIDHPKMRRLARRVGGRALAVGIMECLWQFTARFAIRGDIGRRTNEEIADAVYWEGDPDELVGYLVECGWLDEDSEHRLVVHDWHEHMDNSARKTLRNQGVRCIGEESDGTLTEYGGDFPENSGNGVESLGTDEKSQPLPEPVPEPVPKPEPEREGANALAHSANGNGKHHRDEPQEVFKAFAEVAKACGWKVPVEITAKRRKALRERLRDPTWRDRWREGLERARASEFLAGRNERNWVPDLDWFLRPDTVVKILEGRYESGWGQMVATRAPANWDDD